MKYIMSNNIAVRTNDQEKATKFYSEVLGFPIRNLQQGCDEVDASPLTMYIMKDNELSGAIMELFVDDLEKAKEHLLSNGCIILKWEGKGKDCYIEDPYGLRFNIWEK